MAWPASTTQLAEALRSSDLAALDLQKDLQRIRGLITSAPQSRRALHTVIKRIQEAIDVWDNAAALPGIVAYVRDQKNDQALDVTAEFATMRAAALDIQSTLYAAFPRDGGTGALLMQTDDAQGNLIDLTFSVAQMAPLVTLIDAYVATVG